MNNELLETSDPAAFHHKLHQEYNNFQKRVKPLPDSVVLNYLKLNDHIATNGLDSVYHQGYKYSQLNALIVFLHEMECAELARRLERGRNIYYRRRNDLLTFIARDAAGLDGNHLTEDEWEKLNQLEAGMYGSEDGLLAKSERPFMNFIKAHPETLQEIEQG